mgnify:CR=1 FL=1|tara:strand:- start:482 stop:961 length:480 start_codon:yes stop_codon:yes gene_type:complete
MISKNNLLILIFSLIISFFVSYEDKKYKLETYFGNNLRNYYQVENIFKFKTKDMIFDYAGTESFKVIIDTNNLDQAKNDVKKFIQELNLQMNRECSIIKNQGLLDEFETFCSHNRVDTSKETIYENEKFNYFKFVLVFLNIYLILSLLIAIISNIKLNK